MATYYVGSGGNNANAGTSWALRKATLNGAEDIPVAAGDTVYVGAGTYRETLTCDVSGSSGSPITYVADVTGQNTDGVGGIVRITGSDNDQTATRSNAISASSKNYRTFTGFAIDTTSSSAISLTDCTNWIIQDSALLSVGGTAINVAGASQAATTIRRCAILGGLTAVVFTHTLAVNDTAHLVESCLLMAGASTFGVSVTRVGGITVKNCTIASGSIGIRVGTALAAGQTLTAYNNIITGCATGLSATTTAEFVDDYNNVYNNGTPRTNVTAGANSVTYSPLLETPLMSSGVRYPWNPFALSQFSQLAAKTGSSPATLDLFGIARPATNSKNSWGAIQYQPMLREATTVRTGGASLRLSDAGRHQMFVPVTNTSTTFSCYVQWGTDYAGTKPQMIIKQPGQSDTTVTATGSAGSWEQLTATLTPAATPGYVVVEFVSSNTATSGSYSMYVDDFTVS